MNDKLLNKITQQINAELYSGYMYSAMSNRCKIMGLHGFAKYFNMQGFEEGCHAKQMIDFLVGKNIYPKLLEVNADFNFENAAIESIALQYYTHETEVTSLIASIFDEATTQKDYLTATFYDDFLKAQIEGEKEALELVNRVKAAGTNIIALDLELE